MSIFQNLKDFTKKSSVKTDIVTKVKKHCSICDDIFLLFFWTFLILSYFRQPMETENPAFSSSIFECNYCDFRTNKKSNYKEHLLTRKHILATNGNFFQQFPAKVAVTSQHGHVCINCNAKYKDKSGLWKHKKKCPNNIEENLDCIYNTNTCSNVYNSATNVNTNMSSNVNSNSNTNNLITIDKDIFMSMIKDNTEIKSMLFKVLENGINNVNTNYNNSHNNNNNKTFNLQFFLNETCKNAMNITDFVNSIQPTLEDLENVGRVGYAEGISNIIINKLSKMEVSERPFHCSDLKREIMYIKNEDVWSKETNDKPILLKAIKEVAHKNIQNINMWKEKYPGCSESDSRKNDTFLHIISNSMCGSTKEETNKNFNKIVSNLSKKVNISQIKNNIL